MKPLEGVRVLDLTRIVSALRQRDREGAGAVGRRRDARRADLPAVGRADRLLRGGRVAGAGGDLAWSTGDEIDAPVAEWTRRRSTDEAVGALTQIGMAAGPVQPASIGKTNPQVLHRGALAPLRHPALEEPISSRAPGRASPAACGSPPRPRRAGRRLRCWCGGRHPQSDVGFDPWAST